MLLEDAADSDAWYHRHVDPRAHRGGEVGLDGKARRGGQFQPFYVPRPLMPQVSDKDYPALQEFLRRLGIPMVLEEVVVSDVRAHQRIDVHKVVNMPESVADIPTLISEEPFTLDGNHRWWKHVMLKRTTMSSYRIYMPFENAIDLLFSFSKTTTTER